MIRATCICAITIVLAVATASGAPPSSPQIATTPFFDDFTTGSVNADTWLIAHRQWGGIGVNGGVVPKNVAVEDGHLVLTGLGKFYEGPVLGINKYGIPRTHGRRIGGAIATRQYFASGRYEVRARVAPHFGVCSAVSSMHYREFYPGSPQYVPSPEAPGKPYIINHEIDIELPGRPAKLAFDDVAFDYGLFNTWCGQREDQFNDTYLKIGQHQDDGDFHVYRYEWHTGDDSGDNPPRVEFFVDDRQIYTSREHIPDAAARFWLQLWFPDRWAGEPYFDETQMFVDWVRITPYGDANDRAIAESYPDDGWARAVEPLTVQFRERLNRTAPPDKILTAADFETPEPRNNLGGVYRSFARYPAEASVHINATVRQPDTGQALQLDYKVPTGHWAGFWMRFGETSVFLDARAYSYITFMIKGDSGGESIEIGVSDRSWIAREDSRRMGHVRDFLADGVTTDWQKVIIPLAGVADLDRRELNGISFTCDTGSGTVFIDNVQLED